MTRIGRPLSSPADAPRSLYDDVTNVVDVLVDSGMPDYLANALADVAMADWTPEAWADALRDVKRHVQPILDNAECGRRAA